VPPSAPPPSQPVPPASSAAPVPAAPPASLAAPGPAAPPATADAPAPTANGAGHAVTVTVPDQPIVLDLEGLRAVWPAVIEAVMAENALCAALLADAVPVAVDGALVTIAFAPSADFLRRKANDDGYRQCVAAAVRTVTGSRAQIAYVLAEVPSVEQREVAEPAPPTEDEWVRRFVAEFDAEEIIPDPEDPGPSESEAKT